MQADEDMIFAMKQELPAELPADPYMPWPQPPVTLLYPLEATKGRASRRGAAALAAKTTTETRMSSLRLERVLRERGVLLGLETSARHEFR